MTVLNPIAGRMAIRSGRSRQLVLLGKYINEYLERDIKLADLAQLLGISQFDFSRMFKRAIGRVPCQYPIQQRIEGAKLLLKQKERSIVDIAVLVRVQQPRSFAAHSFASLRA